MRFLLVLAVLGACGATGSSARGHRKTDGAITGLSRDGDSAEPLGAATVVVKLPNGTDASGVSGRDGMYLIDHLAPGRYSVVGTYANQTVTTTNVQVDAGEATYVDMSFTPGRPIPYTIDYSAARFNDIHKYRPKDGRTLIDGTVSDMRTRVRIPGAVVTAYGPAGTYADTLQTISDDNGRYRFEPVPPGVYIVSAYYSVGGRGQIEVRRSDIKVEMGDELEVPLQIETARH